MKLGIELRKMVEQTDIPVKKNWFYWMKVKLSIWNQFNLAKRICKDYAMHGMKDFRFAFTPHEQIREEHIDVLMGLAVRIREEEMNATIENDPVFGKLIHIEW